MTLSPLTRVTQLTSNTIPPNSIPVRRRAFTSLENAHFRMFFLAATAAMMADNIEHVISFWVIFQKFHSAALAGFAVVSHWVPYLLLAGFTGRTKKANKKSP